MPFVTLARHLRTVMVFGVLAFGGAGVARAVTIVIDNDNPNNSAGSFSLISGLAWSVTGVPSYFGQWADDYAYGSTSDPVTTVEWRPTPTATATSTSTSTLTTRRGFR